MTNTPEQVELAQKAAENWFMGIGAQIEDNRLRTGGSFADAALAALEDATKRLTANILSTCFAPQAQQAVCPICEHPPLPGGQGCNKSTCFCDCIFPQEGDATLPGDADGSHVLITKTDNATYDRLVRILLKEDHEPAMSLLDADDILKQIINERDSLREEVAQKDLANQEDQDLGQTPARVAPVGVGKDIQTSDANHWLVMALHGYRAHHDFIWRQKNADLDGECPCGRCIHARAALSSTSLPDAIPSDAELAGRLRPITDKDLTRTANKNYDLGRKHGKEEMMDERETLIYWLLRAYQLGYREGWAEGPNRETMSGLRDVLTNAGYDPNIGSDAAQDLMVRIGKRFASKPDTTKDNLASGAPRDDPTNPYYWTLPPSVSTPVTKTDASSATRDVSQGGPAALPKSSSESIATRIAEIRERVERITAFYDGSVPESEAERIYEQTINDLCGNIKMLCSEVDAAYIRGLEAGAKAICEFCRDTSANEPARTRQGSQRLWHKSLNYELNGNQLCQAQTILALISDPKGERWESRELKKLQAEEEADLRQRGWR